MARFFIATLNYAPEPTGFAPRVTLLAEHLAEHGHDVEVFTGFPFTPAWRRRDEDRGRVAATERIGGVTLHRVTHFIPRRPSSAVQRILMEGSFCLAAAPAMATAVVSRGRPDLLIYVGAQPAIAMLTRVVAALTGRPYVVNITDLATQLARDVGILGQGRLAGFLERFEFAAYRGAAAANVLCRSFAESLASRGYPPDRIRLARDPIDIERIRPLPRDLEFRDRHGVPRDAFVVLHAGSMGVKQGLLSVVEAARQTRERGLCWIFVGEGEGKRDLVDAVRDHGVAAEVRFLPFQREDEMSRMFAAADVLLLTQLQSVKDTVIPSKLLTYMAAGRPVLAAVNPGSQAAEILTEAGGGRLVAPESPSALAEGALWFQSQPEGNLAAYGRNNRAYAEEHFDRRKILAGHERFLADAVPRRPSA